MSVGSPRSVLVKPMALKIYSAAHQKSLEVTTLPSNDDSRSSPSSRLIEATNDIKQPVQAQHQNPAFLLYCECSTIISQQFLSQASDKAPNTTTHFCDFRAGFSLLMTSDRRISINAGPEVTLQYTGSK